MIYHAPQKKTPHEPPKKSIRGDSPIQPLEPLVESLANVLQPPLSRRASSSRLASKSNVSLLPDVDDGPNVRRSSKRASRRVSTQQLENKHHELKIVTLSGKKFVIPAVGSDTIESVQERIHEKLGVAPARQLLSTRPEGPGKGSDQLLTEVRSQSGQTERQRKLCEFRLPQQATLLLTSFAELRPRTCAGDFCRIDNTELRAISLQQLDSLVNYIRKRSDSTGTIDGWYDLNPTGSSYGDELHTSTINLYHVADWIIKPATYAHRCSYVELIAASPEEQRPSWFVSHWWGESVLRFVESLHAHSEQRGLGTGSNSTAGHVAVGVEEGGIFDAAANAFQSPAYWVCAYANNQHDLGAEVVADPSDTSFMKAMRLCTGVVLVLDEKATPFERVWCCYEEALAVTPSSNGTKWILLDIATVVNGEAVLITDGLTAEERRAEAQQAGAGWRKKAEREKHFPVEIIDKALKIDIGESQASFPKDKHRILNSLAGRSKEELDEPHANSHESYAQVNTKLRAIFALAGWHNVVNKDSSVLDIRERRRLLNLFSNTLRADSGRLDYNLSFFGCAAFTNSEFSDVVHSLPPHLRVLTLNLGNCKSIDTTGIVRLAKGLPCSLHWLNLDFFICEIVNDEALINLAKHLPESLTYLRLNFWRCAISDDGVVGLADALPRVKDLSSLHLIFCKCLQVTNRGLLTLAGGLCKGLRELTLDFNSCYQIGSEGFAGLASHLPHDLEKLSLNFKACEAVDDDGLRELCRELPPGLQHLRLELDDSGIEEVTLARVRAKPLWVVQRWQRALLTEHIMRTVIGPLFSNAISSSRDCTTLHADVVTLLAQRLKHKDARVRCGAAGALAEAGRGSFNVVATDAAALAVGACTVGTTHHDPIASLLASKMKFLRCVGLETVHGLALWKAALPYAPHLNEFLRDDDIDLRTCAISIIGHLGANASHHLQTLAAFTGDPDRRIRMAAIVALGNFGTCSAPYVGRLADCLSEEDLLIRTVTCKALLELPHAVIAPHVPSLAGALDTDDDELRSRVYIALSNLGDVRCASAYASVLDHAHWCVRREAAKALGQIGSVARPHKDALIERLTDAEPDRRVWAAALYALDRIGINHKVDVQVLAERLHNEHEEVRAIACEAFMRLPDGVTAVYTQDLAMVLSHDDPSIQGRIKNRLGRLGDKARAHALVAALKNKDLKVRKAALGALASIKSGTHAPFKELIHYLGDHHSDVAESAVDAFLLLSKAAVSQAVQHLVDALDDHRMHWRCRQRTIVVLSRLGGDAIGSDGVRAIADCLADNEWQLRSEAARALASVGDLAMPYASDLARLLSDDDPDVRRSASEAVASLGGTIASRYAHLFALLLHDPDEGIRRNAVIALGHSGSSASPYIEDLVVCLADRKTEVRDATKTALLSIGATVVRSLARLVESHDEALKFLDSRRNDARFVSKVSIARQVAAQILSCLEPRIVVPAAVSLSKCAAGDEDLEVREFARAALVKMGSPVLITILDGSFRIDGLRLGPPGPLVRSGALLALGGADDVTTSGVQALVKYARDPEIIVRTSALDALGRVAAAENITVFVQCMDDAAVKVRLTCVAGLYRAVKNGAKNEDAFCTLLNCFGDPEDVVRRAAVDSLVGLGHDAASILSAGLESRSWRVRLLAAEALGQIRPAELDEVLAAECMSQLAALFTDSDRDTRMAAIRSCAEFGVIASPYVEELRSRVSDDSKLVQKAAADALDKLNASPIRAQDKINFPPHSKCEVDALKPLGDEAPFHNGSRLARAREKMRALRIEPVKREIKQASPSPNPSSNRSHGMCRQVSPTSNDSGIGEEPSSVVSPPSQRRRSASPPSYRATNDYGDRSPPSQRSVGLAPLHQRQNGSAVSLTDTSPTSPDNRWAAFSPEPLTAGQHMQASTSGQQRSASWSRQQRSQSSSDLTRRRSPPPSQPSLPPTETNKAERRRMQRIVSFPQLPAAARNGSPVPRPPSSDKGHTAARNLSPSPKLSCSK